MFSSKYWLPNPCTISFMDFTDWQMQRLELDSASSLLDRLWVRGSQAREDEIGQACFSTFAWTGAVPSTDWRKWLAFFHKKATLFHDPNGEFLRSTGRVQPVCLLMHQIKLSFLLLMKYVAFPRKIWQILKWYPFPFPWFLMQKKLKGK